ncbi:hypothetical protein [Massilia aerilata]|uniref:Uncharacterized protein n=1 Tax=Massilia aerilata TaxID=453817 RepID=A0ABW0S545_9BURK
MTYSCSDFTGNLVNHLFANGLITAAVVNSDDLEHQATAAMEAISNLAQRANAQLPLSGQTVPATIPQGQSRSTQFMDELLGAHETLTGIAECKGARTLADCMYMLSAVQKGTSIEVHHPTESEILDVVQSLPSASLWMTYVHEVTE